MVAARGGDRGPGSAPRQLAFLPSPFPPLLTGESQRRRPQGERRRGRKGAHEQAEHLKV